MAVVAWARYHYLANIRWLFPSKDIRKRVGTTRANRASHMISGIPFAWFHLVVVCRHALERCECRMPLHLS